MADIFELIRDDHARHRGLMETIANTSGDTEARREAWNEFYHDVKAHAAAEEETFYAPLIEKVHGQDDARHSIAEHKELDEIMEELNGMDMSSPGWLNRFHTLRHEYEHHMEEEENDIFSTAKTVMKNSIDGSIAHKFSARKKIERGLVDEKSEKSLAE